MFRNSLRHLVTKRNRIINDYEIDDGYIQISAHIEIGSIHINRMQNIALDPDRRRSVHPFSPTVTFRRCADRDAKMVRAERRPFGPVCAVRDRAVPVGRPARLPRTRRWTTGPGRNGRRRGRPDYRARRPDVPQTSFPQDQSTIAAGKTSCRTPNERVISVYPVHTIGGG